MSTKKRRQAGRGTGAPEACAPGNAPDNVRRAGTTLWARRRQHLPQILANSPKWMLRTLKTSDSFLTPSMSPRRLDSMGRRQLFLRTPAAAGHSFKIGIAPYGGGSSEHGLRAPAAPAVPLRPCACSGRALTYDPPPSVPEQ